MENELVLKFFAIFFHKVHSMSHDDNFNFFDFTRFLKRAPDPDHQEIDNACLSDQLFEDCECQRKVLPLFFFLTRCGDNQMSIAELKSALIMGQS